MGALAAQQLAFRDRHLQAAVRDRRRAVLAGRPPADHDHVVVAHALVLSSGGKTLGSLFAQSGRYKRSPASRSISRPSRHEPSGPRQYLRITPTGLKSTAA